jgi:serine/threonine-protein kinase
MSPEQARGETVDHRSDLFSLGSVLYTLCTGQPAFWAAETLAVLKRVCDDMPVPIRALNPTVPDWLAALVLRLLAKDPAQRFQTIRATWRGFRRASLSSPRETGSRSGAITRPGA